MSGEELRADLAAFAGLLEAEWYNGNLDAKAWERLNADLTGVIAKHEAALAAPSTPEPRVCAECGEPWPCPGAAHPRGVPHRLAAPSTPEPSGLRCKSCAAREGEYHGTDCPERTAALNAVLGRVLSLPEMVGEPNPGGRSLVRRTEVTDAIDAALLAAPSTPEPSGWSRATAKGTAIDVDEWNRPLYVRAASSAPEPSGDDARLDALDHHAGWCSCAARGWLQKTNSGGAAPPTEPALDVEQPYVPTPDDLDELLAAVTRSRYASEAVEVVENWTREHWGVESAFTTSERLAESQPCPHCLPGEKPNPYCPEHGAESQP